MHKKFLEINAKNLILKSYAIISETCLAYDSETHFHLQEKSWNWK